MLRKETVTAPTLEFLKDLMRDELEDIAAMKLNAIVGNVTGVRDFIDIAFLSCHLSLKTMTEAYENKYSSRNPLVILKALSYHKDIDFSKPVPIISKKYSWKSIEKRLQEMEKFPSKIFPTSPLS
jgi:hypothetical protein